MSLRSGGRYNGCSIRNKEQLEKSEKCGCFSCCEIFPPSEITDYFSDEERKDQFKIRPHLQILTSKARQILHKNAVDFSMTNQFQHSFEIRPLKTDSAIAVIAKFHDVIRAQIRMLFSVALKYLPLIGYTVALTFIR